MKPASTFSQQRLLKRNTMAQQVLIACLAMTGSLIATPVLAQQANTGATAPVQSLGDIVVTARKRDEKLIEVPISILTYSAKELKAADTSNLYDLAQSAGFTFNQYAANGASGRANGVPVFRGLQGSTALAADASGSLFVDGIFISSGMGSINTVDVQRIEVLKGPQNAFFGRSTFGGAVNFITKNPSDVFQGQINGTVNTRGSADLDLVLEGPLVENMLKGRLVVYTHNKAAPYKAFDGGDLGAEKTQGITGTLYATPSEKMWIRGRLHYQQDDDSQSSAGFITAQGNLSCTGQTFTHQTSVGTDVTYTPGNFYFCGKLPTMNDTGMAPLGSTTALDPTLRSVLQTNSVKDPFLSYAPKLDHTGLRRNTLRASLQAGYELPYNSELEFNIGYNHAYSVASWDLDRSAFTSFQNIATTLVRDTTIDTRWISDKDKSLRGILGASYFTQSYQGSQIDFDNLLVVRTGAGSSATNLSKVPAIYGSVEYDILKDLTVTADARRQKDQITAKSFVNGPTWATDGQVLNGPSYTSTKFNWLPRLSVKYKLNEDTSIYATRSKGVQPLSLNSGFLSASAAAKTYLAQFYPSLSDSFSPQPILNSTEIGIKQRLLNNRVQYSLAAYRQKWKDRLTLTSVFNTPACIIAGQQLTPTCPLPTAGQFVTVGNDALIKGIEFSLDALVTPQLKMGLSIDYKDPKWTNYFNSSFTVVGNPLTPPPNTTAAFGRLNYTASSFNGNTIQWVSKLTAALNATYTMPNLIKNWNGFVRGDVFYDGGSYESDFNYGKSSAATKVNLRAGLDRGDISFEFFVKNLTRDSHFAAETRSTWLGGPTAFAYQGLLVQPPDPREFGMRMTYNFE